MIFLSIVVIIVCVLFRVSYQCHDGSVFIFQVEVMWRTHLFRSEEFLPLLEVVYEKAPTKGMKTKAGCLYMEYALLSSNFKMGLEIGVTCLAQYGLQLNLSPTPESARAEFDHVLATLKDKPIQDFEATLPLVKNPRTRHIVLVIQALSSLAFFSNKNLLIWLACRGSALSITHGFSSAVILLHWAVIAGAHYGHYSLAQKVRALACTLLSRYPEFTTRSLSCHAVFFHSALCEWWGATFATSSSNLVANYRIAVNLGEKMIAAVSAITIVTQLLMTGYPLADIIEHLDEYVFLCRGRRWCFSRP